MKIGIIGSGDVARTLATGLVKHGHEVRLATREPGKLKDFQKTNPMITIGDTESVANFAELAILAVKGTVAVEAFGHAAPWLVNCVVIDTTNPIADLPPENGVLAYFTGGDDSLGERLQDEFPEVHFVKAFNSVGHQHFINPDFGGVKPTMFIAGNEQAAKETVAGLLDQLGWEAADMGMIESSRAIEPLCQLWCLPGILNGRWDHVFKLLRKS